MKYINAFFIRTIALIKLTLIKIIHFNRFHYYPIELISISTKFKLKGNGKIFLNSSIGTRSNVVFSAVGNGIINVGRHCFFNNNCMIACHEKITIGNNVSFGPNVMVYDHDHDFRAEGGIKSQKYKCTPIIIGNNVWIGANTVILRGTVIGDNCVIGAGTVVKGEFPPNTIIIQKDNITTSNYLGSI